MVESLLAIPSTLLALRDLFVGKKPDHGVGLAKLDALRTNLLEFASAAAWFDRPRLLHQHLQRLDNTLTPSTESYTRATREKGRFSSLDYDLATARSCWEDAKADSLDALIEFVGSAQFVKGTIHVKTEAGLIVWVPPWGERIYTLRAEIEEAFQNIDGHLPGPEDVDDVPERLVRAAASRLKALADLVKTQLRFADQELRDRTSEMTKALAALEQDLKNLR